MQKAGCCHSSPFPRYDNLFTFSLALGYASRVVHLRHRCPYLGHRFFFAAAGAPVAAALAGLPASGAAAAAVRVMST